MALAYLLDPCLQHQNRAGVNNVDGWFEVFRMDTDDRATIYKDFNGTLAPARNVIDNNGRVVMIAESGVAYRVAMYLPNGELVYTQQPVFTVGSGGGAGGSTEITSSDGSINVDKTSVGSDTTFDITVARDGSDLLEYVRCDGATHLPDSYIYKPTYTSGTIAVGEKGIELSASQYYHVTAHVRATKTVQRDPFYDEINIRFVLDNGTTQTDCVVEKRIVDYSLGLSQEFEVSTDVMASSDCELLFVIDGHDVQNGAFELIDVEAHRVYSGSPTIPSGVLSRVQAREIYQPILTAGENITIENNVISATGGGGVEQVQSDWTESDTDAKSFIRHKPHTKPVVAGSNITIDETSTQFVISATAEPQEQANWAESDSSSVQYIQNKPDLSVYATTQAMNTALAGKQDVISDLATIRSGAALGATATQPSDLAAGLATKQDTLTAGSNITIQNNVISATAAPQQQADWAESDSSSVQYIQHKPDLSVYATDSELSAGLANKQDVISDLATIRSGAALGTTSVQPSDLATVAESGNYEDLNNKPDLSVFAETSDLATVALTGSYADLTGTPSIPTATSDLTNDSGFITSSDVPVKDVQVSGASVVNAQGIAEISIPQTGVLDVEVNGSSVVDAQGVASIDLSGYATTQSLTSGLAAKQDTISDLSTIRSGAQAGASAVQPGDLKTVAFTGSYSDLTNKPSIPTATSDLTNDSGFITLNDVPAQVQANWTESDSSAASYITNKPQNLVQDASYVHTDNNFTSAEKTKLSGIEAGAQVNTVTDVEVDGVSVVSQGVASINLPTVPVTDVTVNGTSVVSNGTAAVTVPTATSQLTNDSGFITSVTFPVTDVQVDGTSVVNANGVAEVNLSNYATTQALTTGLAAKQDTLTAGTNVSITNNVISATDTTYTAGTGIDITSNVVSVENPLPSSTSSDEGKVLKVDANGDPEWATGGGGTQVNSDWDATSGVAEILNKPVPKTLTAGTGVSISEGVGTITISSNVTAPVQDVTVNGTSVVSNGVAAITITSPTVDQTYDASSTNAQSGVAVAEGISDAIGDLPTNLTSAQIQSLKEALGVDETVLYSGMQTIGDGGSATYNLSELPTNFQKLKVYCCASDNTFPTSQNGNCGMAYFEWDTTMYTPPNTFLPVLMNGNTGTNFTQYWTSANVNGIRTTTWSVQGSLNSATSNAKWFHIYKIVGVHRIASN